MTMTCSLVYSSLVYGGIVYSGLVYSGLVYSGLVYSIAYHHNNKYEPKLYMGMLLPDGFTWKSTSVNSQ